MLKFAKFFRWKQLMLRFSGLGCQFVLGKDWPAMQLVNHFTISFSLFVSYISLWSFLFRYCRAFVGTSSSQRNLFVIYQSGNPSMSKILASCAVESGWILETFLIFCISLPCLRASRIVDFNSIFLQRYLALYFSL